MANLILHRKDSIVLTSIEIIHELGFHGLSTKEIAKRQGISEGTLFKHFETKNQIILSALDYFGKFDHDIFESAQNRRLNPLDALKFAIDAFATNYENYPAITAIPLIYDALLHDPELNEKIKAIFAYREQQVRQLLQAAQEANDLRPDIDLETLLYLIVGSFRMICMNWRLCSGSFSLRKQVLLMLETTFDAFKVK